MLISHHPKFLFVHIQKTGGSSLVSILRRALPRAESYLGTHDHAVWARNALGSEYGSYYSFAFVRNPWERLVSWYSMIVQQSRTPGPPANRFWHYVFATASTFDEFVLRATDTIDDIDGRKSTLFNQLDYLCDETGGVIVHYIGRFEHYARDAQKVLARLGIANVALPNENRSEHDDYRAYYTDETRRVVAERYARDIAYFGYQF